MIHVISSRGRRQPEGIPGCLRDQQVKDAAYPPDQARSRPQFFCLLLRDSQFTRQGMSTGQTGIRSHNCYFFLAIPGKERTVMVVMVHSGDKSYLTRTGFVLSICPLPSYKDRYLLLICYFETRHRSR